ncbi:hypothetical protein EJD96_13505 [Herbaspirillum seropedicae]|uniref:DUF6402 family protein n=1 Tax=Herbaspirillum seropedicae TaxID=964 RepID=UPI00111D8854|nr:DUF6402 family protein [Herbaspirillum seropedicae]QDD65105.1 hypothetical protein EJD96_13505 [Herbaspirillum seropedicae]
MAQGGGMETVAKSRTSPSEIKQGKVCYANVFKLTDLPDIMDKNGWRVASALMRRWFSAKAYEMTDEEKSGLTDARLYPSHLIDCSTTTMDWLLSFPRAKEEYDKIFGEKGWVRSIAPLYESEGARKELVKKLAKSGKFTAKPEPFGNFQDSIMAINELSQFQIKRVGEPWFKAKAYGVAAMNEVVFSDPDLDDLWGAFADFLFKVAGEGMVIPGETVSRPDTRIGHFPVKYYDVIVDSIGVYARDTYDFNGQQYLGHWRKTRPPYVRLYALGDARGSCPDDYLIVNNQKFREHRANSGKGGDVLIFSDMRVTRLRTPYRFRVTPGEIQSVLLPSHAK